MTRASRNITAIPEFVPTDQSVSVECLRSRCRGIAPLEARLETWQTRTLCGDRLAGWIKEHSSPLNIVCTDPLRRNIIELQNVAAQRDIDFQVFFARKANKCLAFVDEASATGAGIDVASLQELQQVLDRNIHGRNIICTAAVKSPELLELCVANEVTVALDNADEMKQLTGVAAVSGRIAPVALRLSGFRHEGHKLHSRFGFDIDDAEAVLQTIAEDPTSQLKVIGLHFHLDGYAAPQRISAVVACMRVLDRLRENGSDPLFLDIGGGVPMSYLEDEAQWNAFWRQLEIAVLGDGEAITYRNHGLGLINVHGELHGKRNCYPFYQSPIRGDWLAEILDAKCESLTIAESLRSRRVQLRCEPGRSILDGCGMTVAEVRFCKQHHSGDWFIGLSMNRTQCRTSSDDFLVDPIVVPSSNYRGSNDLPQEKCGFLVGTYCTESELLSLRRLRFPSGIEVGDLVVFPNTAGYFMHFLESRSHQFPLAKNLVVSDEEDHPSVIDDIDTAAE